METVRRPKYDYEEMFQEDRVDGRVYTDQGVFEDEIERIFHRWWVYVGHASEIPNAGDYKLTRIGLQPVIMSRDEHGGINLLLNRCRHRGNSVCQYEQGNSSFFRCWYHGWTYNNRCDLVGVPYPKAYDESFRKEDFGLTKVPRVEEYRGFVFGCLDPDIITLDEHLGSAKGAIDMFVDQSPVGEIEARAGCNKGQVKGNWKLIGMDGYHIEFVHRSLVLLEKGQDKSTDGKEENSTTTNSNAGETGNFSERTEVKNLAVSNKTRDLGNGHVRLDYSGRTLDPERHLGPLRETEWGRTYLEEMEKRHGEEQAHELLCVKTPHVGIWPNLQLIDSHIRVIHPISADETQILMVPTTLKSVPEEVNINRLRKHEWFYGPAGFGSPDDYEIFERNQIGMQAHEEEQVLLSRGKPREEQESDGTIVSEFTDEVPQRGQLRQWREVMRRE